MELILGNQQTWREENSDLKEPSLEIMKNKYGTYGRNVSWIVKWYGKYRRKVSRIVKRYEKYGRNPSWIVKRFGKYRRKLWKDMKNMEEK